MKKVIESQLSWQMNSRFGYWDTINYTTFLGVVLRTLYVLYIVNYSGSSQSTNLYSVKTLNPPVETEVKLSHLIKHGWS